ncbi:protein of unknown function [Pararobbsia alpina]
MNDEHDKCAARDALRVNLARWAAEVVSAYVHLKANPQGTMTREQSYAKLQERRLQRRSRNAKAE